MKKILNFLKCKHQSNGTIEGTCFFKERNAKSARNTSIHKAKQGYCILKIKIIASKSFLKIVIILD